MYHEVVIANTAEAFEKILTVVQLKAERIRRIRHEHELSDRALLWGEKKKIVVLPRKPSDILVQHLQQVIGAEGCVRVLWPRKCELSLCDAVLADEDLREELSQLIRENRGIRITSYAVTPQFATLLSELRAEGLKFSSNLDGSSGTAWATRYLDSKAGFRAEMNKLEEAPHGVLLPEGFVCADAEEALGAVDWFLDRGRSCIVKANLGEAGWGLNFVKANSAKTNRHVLNAVRVAIDSESIWETGPLVVEEWIGAEVGTHTHSPSAEMCVSDSGAMLTYVCDQLVDKLGRFGGVIIGPGFPVDEDRRQIERVAAVIGRHFHGLGVRGHFDIDFVVSAEGHVMAVETNVRRTGGTHVFDLKTALGVDFERHFFLAEDSYTFGKAVLAPAEIVQRLRAILFSREKREGVVITLVPRKMAKLGYIILAPGYEQLMKLQRQLRSVLAR